MRTRGVYFNQKSGLYIARIRHQGQRLIIGKYPTEQEAARAYDDKARALYADRAIVNHAEPASWGT